MRLSAIPFFALAHAAAYTLGMCQKAMWEKARGRSDDRVRELTQDWARGLCDRMQIEVRAFGVDGLDGSAPSIIMANHQSYLDVLALYRALPSPCGVIAKKQLFSIPLFGGVMRALGCVAIDRSRRAEAMTAMREAASTVRNGRAIVVFPEGTRSPGDRVLRLKKGPFYLAGLAEVPIVPVGIRGTAALMPRRNTGIRSGVIEVHFGEPILPSGSSQGGARSDLTERVRSELSRLAGVPALD